MSKKSGRLFKAKGLKKIIRRSGTAIGVTALTIGSLAAVMSPGIRASTRRLKDRVVNRLTAGRTGHEVGEDDVHANGQGISTSAA
jgi:hypothetical protein